MEDSFDNPGIFRRSWFRPAVAAWFALLLGGGLWLMPPDVHASIARATGLAKLVAPQSAAGLAILCGIAALFGLAIGWVVAHRVALAASPRAFAPGFDLQSVNAWDDLEEDELPRRRRVFSAREDIGETGIAISAPVEDDIEYEEEFSLEDVAPPTPGEDFDAVYAEMAPDYPARPEDEVRVEEPEPESEAPIEYEAEFVEIEDTETFAEPAPAPLHEPIDTPAAEPPAVEPGPAEPDMDLHPTGESEATGQPLGDMSLDALLDRLAGAIETHQKLVATSEKAAAQPAPQTQPMAPEPAPEPVADGPEGEAHDTGLPDASDDDPVIAFLRREANRRMPHRMASDDKPEADAGDSPRHSQTEAQAALRNALDRLGQTGRRD